MRRSRLRLGAAKGHAGSLDFLLSAEALRKSAPRLLGPDTIHKLYLAHIADLLEAAGRHFQKEEEAEENDT